MIIVYIESTNGHLKKSSLEVMTYSKKWLHKWVRKLQPSVLLPAMPL